MKDALPRPSGLPGVAEPAAIIDSMPIYEYRCSNGHQFEVFQAMSDDPVSACTGVRGAGRAGLPPGRRPLQGLGLLHHRLRAQGRRQGVGGRRRLGLGRLEGLKGLEGLRRAPRAPTTPRAPRTRRTPSRRPPRPRRTTEPRPASSAASRPACAAGWIPGSFFTARTHSCWGMIRLPAAVVPRWLQHVRALAEADQRAEHQLGHRPGAHAGDHRLRSVPADERPLDEVVRQPERVGEPAADPVEDRLLELDPVDVRDRWAGSGRSRCRVAAGCSRGSERG